MRLPRFHPPTPHSSHSSLQKYRSVGDPVRERERELLLSLLDNNDLDFHDSSNWALAAIALEDGKRLGYLSFTRP